MKRTERLNIRRILAANRGTSYEIAQKLGITAGAITKVLDGSSVSARITQALREAAQQLSPGVDLTKPILREKAKFAKDHDSQNSR